MSCLHSEWQRETATHTTTPLETGTASTEADLWTACDSLILGFFYEPFISSATLMAHSMVHLHTVSHPSGPPPQYQTMCAVCSINTLAPLRLPSGSNTTTHCPSSANQLTTLCNGWWLFTDECDVRTVCIALAPSQHHGLTTDGQ